MEEVLSLLMTLAGASLLRNAPQPTQQDPCSRRGSRIRFAFARTLLLLNPEKPKCHFRAKVHLQRVAGHVTRVRCD